MEFSKGDQVSVRALSWSYCKFFAQQTGVDLGKPTPARISGVYTDLPQHSKIKGSYDLEISGLVHTFRIELTDLLDGVFEMVPSRQT